MDKKYIGDCRKIQSELIRTHPIAGGAVGKQIKLLFFDAILHIAACTVDITLHCFSILSRQKSESPRKMIRTSGNLALIAPTSLTKISRYPHRHPRWTTAVGRSGENHHRTHRGEGSSSDRNIHEKPPLLLNLLEQKKSASGAVDLAVILYNDFAGIFRFPALAIRADWALHSVLAKRASFCFLFLFM